MKFLASLILLAVCSVAQAGPLCKAIQNAKERRETRQGIRRGDTAVTVTKVQVAQGSATCANGKCELPAKPLATPDPFTKK